MKNKTVKTAKKTTQVKITAKTIKSTKENKRALLIPAGLILGIGCGFLFNNIVAGMFVGLWVGMVAFAILIFMKK